MEWTILHSKDDFTRRLFEGNIIITYNGFFPAFHSTGCEHFVLSSKAVNREDKLSRRYRDRDLAKFESSRRYRER
jgi:hypothetical protein